VEGITVGEEQGLLKILAHGQTILAYGSAQAGQRVILTFRPEEVILTREKPRTSVRNWFYGPVEEIKSFDRMIMVSVNCGFNLKALISRASLEELNLQSGEQVWAGIKASALTVAAP
jgi:molybdopterin-binding protein